MCDVSMVHQKSKIICVEDDSVVQVAVKNALEERGFSIDFFDTAEAALAAIKSNDYDLALLDIGLPGKNGFHLSEQIREIGKPIKIVGLSARSSAHHNEKAIMHGMDDFLEKPLTEAGCRIIENLLSRSFHRT